MAKKAKVVSIVPQIQHEVGTQLTIDPEDANSITIAEQKLLSAQLRLGQKLEEIEAIKVGLFATVTSARQEYTEAIIKAGQKKAISIGPESKEHWEFRQDQLTFVRVG